jgi:hypothetical protein
MRTIEKNQDANRKDRVQDLRLGRWFTFDQQMMGLLDGSDLPFRFECRRFVG